MITKIHVWDIIELAFTGRDVFQNPYTEADFSVRFVSQTGEQYTAPCFWDGDNVWKVRFAPPAPGLWHWESYSESEKGGFSGRSGKFEAVEYQGENPVFRHGFLKVNSNGRGFVHADNTPFFWTGDTVWAATSKASLDEWKEYIEFRSSQGFNVVQMNVLPQYDASGIESRSPFAADEDGQWDMYRIDPEYFRCLDEMMAVTRNAGMYTALVVVWYTYVEKIYEPEARPSKKARFDKKTIKLFARYLAARYAAFGAVWIVSGDSNYNAEKEEISVYHTAAETIKDAVSHYPLITAHLSGNTSTPEGINQAEWLDFHMYQSGHCTDGPAISVRYAEKDRALRPIRPVINAEPCYEGIGYVEGTRRVDQADIRNIAWVSILAGGNAGITYGAHGLWGWHRAGEDFAHESLWMAPYEWREALRLNGAYEIIAVKEFFKDLPWWELGPRKDLIAAEGAGDTIVSSTEDEEMIVVYGRNTSLIELQVKKAGNYELEHYNLLTGEKREYGFEKRDDVIVIDSSSFSEGAVFILRKS